MTQIHSDPNEALVQFLDRYCESEIAPGYAVMLKGPWGSGKTWFVDSYRERLTKRGKRSLYVTLFGVKRPSDVSDQFFAQIHTVLGNEKVQKGWAIAKSLLKGALKVDLDGDGKEDGSLQISIPDLGKWASTEGAVLIFDDLERVGMPVDDILGYINQFVEHEGYRVIIIANEIKTIEKSLGFTSMKEKVIGRTFEIRPNVEAALEHFLKEIVTSHAFTILNERREVILAIFRRAKYGNLRQLRQSILDFSYLWTCFEGNAAASRKEFVDRLVNDVLTLSIEIRAGTLVVDDVRKLGSIDWLKYMRGHKAKEGDSPQSPADAAIARHGFDDHPRLALLSVAYAEFFESGYLLSDAANHALSQSPYLANSTTPSWRRLWYFTELSDIEFSQFLEDVYLKFVGLKYDVEEEIHHVSAMLLAFASMGLTNKSLGQIRQTTRSVVLKLARLGKLNPGPKAGYAYSTKADMSAYGLGYMDRESAEFLDFVNFYRDQQRLVRTKKMIEWAGEWMSLLSTDSATWAKHLLPGEPEQSWFAEEPVFSSISGRSFCSVVRKLELPDLENVRRGIRGRYDVLDERTKWKLDELPFLKMVVELLDKRVSGRTRSPKLSLYAIKSWLVPDLHRAIKKIEAYAALP